MTTLLLAAAETMGGASLISILVWLLVFGIIVYAVFLVLGMLPLPQPIKTIIVLLIAVVMVIWLLARLGIMI